MKKQKYTCNDILKKNLSMKIKTVIDDNSFKLANEIMKVVDGNVDIQSDDDYTFTYIKVAALSKQLLNKTNLFDEQIKKVNKKMRWQS